LSSERKSSQQESLASQIPCIRGTSDSDNKNLVIDVLVEGKSVLAVVDTAAQVSVISSSTAKSCLSNKITEKSYLRGIADRLVSAEYVREVNVSIGSINHKTPMYVADIPEDMLLGLDILSTLGAVIDLHRQEVRFGEDIIVAALVREGVETSVVSRVTLIEKTRVPSNSSKIVVAQLSHCMAEDFMFNPLHDAAPCLLPASLHTRGNHVNLQLINDTNACMVIEAGTVIGTVAEVQIMPYSTEGVSKVREFSTIDQEIPKHLIDLFDRSATDLADSEKEQLKHLLIVYADVFAAHDLDLGCFTAVQHEILVENVPPVKERLRRVPRVFEEEEEKHLKSMLDAGVIQPSNSPWASSPVLVRKKDGGVRWCLDFRKLNAVTKKDAFPLPLISDCLDALAGNTYMSTLDMASGYWQIEIRPEDREKTAFITRFGLFEHRRMSFGLCNAPSTFQRAINLVLRGLTWKTVLAFLDDVLILGRDFSDHLFNLREVLERFRLYNLKLKPKKCVLFRTKAKFLGKIVTGNTVSIDPESINSVKNWPEPKCTREVESFLGFVNYHREHIPHLAELAVPMYALTGKNPFKWTQEHSAVFRQLKEAMLSAHVLALPRREGMFILDTDASDSAIGGQLSQLHEEVELPIAFASKSLTPAQKKYCTTRKELLALIAFTRQFRHYLLGRRFTVRTDHSSLAWLMRFKNVEGQLARWLEELAQYDMQIVHRKGKAHANADALSRIPDTMEPCDCYQAGVDVCQLPCQGCSYCQRAHKQWTRFEDDVDDVVPLAMVMSPAVPTVRVCSSGESNWTNTMSPTQRSVEQDKDPDLQVLRQWVKENRQPSQEELAAQSPVIKKLWANRPLLLLEDDILWYIWKGDQDKRLWLVPKHLQGELLSLAHSNILSGHRGRDGTLQKLRKHFFWPSVGADVEHFVKACIACSRSKRLKRRNKAPLQKFTTGAPMERCHMDILGPLPTTPAGNKYILLLVDQFTKWVEAVPIANQTAETIAKAAIDHLFCRFGCPLEICTDQGANFTSQIFCHLCDLLQIAKTRTTPYHPSANGQVERLNSVLLQMIRCTLKDGQNTWDTLLQMLVGAIRSTENRSTGFTPNFMMLGRETVQPLQLMTGVKFPTSSINEFVSKIQDDMQRAHHAARQTLQKTQCRQKREYDVHARLNEYAVGDVVLLIDSASRIGQCKKLAPLWKGPYVIVEIVSPVLCKIASSRKEWVVHHDRLRLCDESPLPLWVRRRRHHILGLPAPSSSLASGETFLLSSSHDDTLARQPTYCLCQGIDDGRFMIACDSCYQWFHGECVKITEEAADKLDFYICPGCRRRGYAC